jgi:hypothetical protein
MGFWEKVDVDAGEVSRAAPREGGQRSDHGATQEPRFPPMPASCGSQFSSGFGSYRFVVGVLAWVVAKS